MHFLLITKTLNTKGQFLGLKFSSHVGILHHDPLHLVGGSGGGCVVTAWAQQKWENAQSDIHCWKIISLGFLFQVATTATVNTDCCVIPIYVHSFVFQ